MARPRKPTHLKLVTGTNRKETTNPAEPKPTRGRPVMPAHISIRGAQAWKKLAKDLHGMGVLTVADGFALERLAETYAELLSAQAVLDSRVDPDTGEVGRRTYETVTQTGGRMFRAYPEVAMLADADRRLRGWMSDFGLTPATRSKVSGTAVGADNEFD